jgi:spermidine/putrescine-binding protein
MTQEKKAAVVAIVVLGGALAVVLGQKNGWRASTITDQVSQISLKPQPKADPTPQDAIYGMLDAARAGDVKLYLANYSGQMSAALQQSIAETTEPKFAQYLKDSNAAIKGVAISEPQTLTDTQVKIRVEYVYQDRNEAQMMVLEKQAGVWKIIQVDSTERVKTLVPYGTPVQ